MTVYLQAGKREQENCGSILSHFAFNSLSPLDRALYGWLRLVVLKNTPLGHIENAESRAWFASAIYVVHSSAVKVIFN